jgi:hypothetical protein
MTQSENPIQLLGIILNKNDRLIVDDPVEVSKDKWELKIHMRGFVYIVEWSCVWVPSPCFTLTRPDGSSHHGPFLAILNEILDLI